MFRLLLTLTALHELIRRGNRAISEIVGELAA
jgi:hypothetical protein